MFDGDGEEAQNEESNFFDEEPDNSPMGEDNPTENVSANNIVQKKVSVKSTLKEQYGALVHAARPKTTVESWNKHAKSLKSVMARKNSVDSETIIVMNREKL